MLIHRLSGAIMRLLMSSQAVEDAVTIQGPVIAPLLEERFASRIAGLVEGLVPNFLAVLLTLQAELTASREALALAEERHIVVQRQITALSQERVSLFDALQSDFTWLRGHVDKVVGTGKAEAEVVAGLQGPTAQSSDGLLRQVKVAVKQLSKPDLELAEDRFGATRIDAGAIATTLGGKADELSLVLEQLAQSRREAQLTQTEKNRMVDQHRKTFFPIARSIEGFFRLAGHDELADRVRPSRSQRGRRAVEVEEAPDGSPAEEGSTEGGSTAESAVDRQQGQPARSAKLATPPESAPQAAPAGSESPEAR